MCRSCAFVVYVFVRVQIYNGNDLLFDEFLLLLKAWNKDFLMSYNAGVEKIVSFLKN